MDRLGIRLNIIVVGGINLSIDLKYIKKALFKILIMKVF